jgi:hypothetical protein
MLPTTQPSCDHLDDTALIEAFEGLAIPPAAFRHREHVRLAFALLQREAEFGAGADRFCRALKRFAAAHGAHGKYHATLTWAYLALIHERMHVEPCADSFELLERVPDLFAAELARRYDVAAIVASPLARAVFVLPERG